MINGVDDDLLINLVDNFPLAVPIPNWNEENGDHVASNLTHGTNGGIESRCEDSRYTGLAEQERNFGHIAFDRNNMPRIY